MNDYTIHDSGQRQEFAGGMVRDTDAGKVQWHRVADGPMLRRWAEHLTRGAAKYPDVRPGVANWTLADGDETYQRFRQSAFRHFLAWFNGERDEDHAAATFFNINGAEMVSTQSNAKALEKYVSVFNANAERDLAQAMFNETKETTR